MPLNSPIEAHGLEDFRHRPSLGNTQEGDRYFRIRVNRLLKNPLSPRLLKKVQMQGGAARAERGVLRVRRSDCAAAPTQQMGLFQQPAKGNRGT